MSSLLRLANEEPIVPEKAKNTGENQNTLPGKSWWDKRGMYYISEKIYFCQL